MNFRKNERGGTGKEPKGKRLENQFGRLKKKTDILNMFWKFAPHPNFDKILYPPQDDNIWSSVQSFVIFVQPWP